MLLFEASSSNICIDSPQQTCWVAFLVFKFKLLLHFSLTIYSFYDKVNIFLFLFCIVSSMERWNTLVWSLALSDTCILFFSRCIMLCESPWSDNCNTFLYLLWLCFVPYIWSQSMYYNKETLVLSGKPLTFILKSWNYKRIICSKATIY